MQCCLLDVITSTYDNINDNAFTGLVMVDLKKAFDTVSHSILLSKLQNYGIRGVAADLRAFVLEAGRLVFILSRVKPKTLKLVSAVTLAKRSAIKCSAEDEMNRE